MNAKIYSELNFNHFSIMNWNFYSIVIVIYVLIVNLWQNLFNLKIEFKEIIINFCVDKITNETLKILKYFNNNLMIKCSILFVLNKY